MHPVMTPDLDVAANRAARKYGRGEMARRLLWSIAHYAFRLSPRPLWGWRAGLLRAFGARIGRNVRVEPTVRITMPENLAIGDDVGIGHGVILYALGPIAIGDRTGISQGAHLCAGTHDWRRADRPLLRPPIVIAQDVWVCADAFVGPGVTVGHGAIVGARAVVMKDVPPHVIATGNPASFRPQSPARSQPEPARRGTPDRGSRRGQDPLLN